MAPSCSLCPRFDLMSLTDASHSWALLLTKSFYWNQSHKDWIKSKVQGMWEFAGKLKHLGHSEPRWSTWDTERGNALERSSDSLSWCTAPTLPHSWPEPHSQRVVLSKVTIHTHRVAPAVQPDPSYTVYSGVRWNRSQDQCVHTKPTKSWRKVLLHWWQKTWG